MMLGHKNKDIRKEMLFELKLENLIEFVSPKREASTSRGVHWIWWLQLKKQERFFSTMKVKLTQGFSLLPNLQKQNVNGLSTESIVLIQMHAHTLQLVLIQLLLLQVKILLLSFWSARFRFLADAQLEFSCTGIKSKHAETILTYSFRCIISIPSLRWKSCSSRAANNMCDTL